MLLLRFILIFSGKAIKGEKIKTLSVLQSIVMPGYDASKNLEMPMVAIL